MSYSLRRSVFLAVFGLSLIGSAWAQDDPLAGERRPTGLIPLDAKQLQEVLTTWPRVDRVNINRIGLERLNKVRALKGMPPLSFDLARPVGQEVESSIYGAGVPIQPIDLNPELLGDLPVFVDNSTLPHFPPIRSQGAIGSCASFSSTYYQLSYMTALQRGLDITDPDDNTNKYSPKWSYNMLNDGADLGTSLTENLALLEKHGASTWAELPYDANYLAWCLNGPAWRNALSVRTMPPQYSWHTETDSGLEVIKQLLANGYVVTFGTYVYSWQTTTIEDDPSTLDDNAAVGKAVCYWMNGTSGGHAMTIVGYNDAIWTDVNDNDIIDPGEKGALRIANSWGADWNPTDGGFVWMAYDALKDPSAVPDGPSAGRVPAIANNIVYVLTARNNYSPMLIAEFTVSHAKRNQMIMRLGHSDTSVTLPTTLWTPLALAQQGGAFAFDGTATAVPGTFVLDFTDVLPPVGVLRRLYLGMSDSTFDDAGTLSAFRLIDTTTEQETVIESTIVPLYADAGSAYSYVDHTYNGPTYNNPPAIHSGQVIPATGTTLETYLFAVWYSDADGNVPTVKDVYIDGAPYAMAYYPGSGSVSASNGWYTYETTLVSGTHDFRYHFEDGLGGSSEDPITVAPPPYYTYSGPIVAVAHSVSAPNIPAGDTGLDLGQSYAFSTGGSICEFGHDVQYQFDWGDGTYSGWLAVGVTGASHAWNSLGSFSVRAQARCAVDTIIVSSWSSALTVSVTGSVLFTEDFMDATGWLQQSSGFSATLWYLFNSSFAGGTPYEIRCQWYNVNPGTTRLITPALDTTGLTALRLSFKHFLDTYGPGCTLKVQTSPDKSVWTDEAWVIGSGSVNLGPETVETTLAHNLGIATTYVAFVITGNLYQYDYWYIDDVLITLAAPAKVDFNKDGQEDILWRYYGGGAYQGLNLAWLMAPEVTAAPVPLTTAAPDTVVGSSIGEEIPGSALQAPLATPIPRAGVAGSIKPLRTVLMGWGARAPRPALTAKAPVGIGRDPATPGRGLRAGERGLADFPVLRDSWLAGASGGGTVELASLALGSEVVISVLPDTTWEIAGTADFDGDGDTDILWRNYGTGAFQGMNDIWFMNGVSFVSESIFSIVSDTSWRIAGTGDFNGDDKTDILWRNYGSGALQGMNVIWFMDDGAFQSETVFSVIPDTSWKIAGTGDFNGDDKTDILWRNYGSGAFQGMNVIWFMDGAAFQSEAVFSIILDTAWEIAATGDYDGDGETDIVWRYYGAGAFQGMNDIWYMNGTAFLREEIFSVIPDTNWRIQNR